MSALELLPSTACSEAGGAFSGGYHDELKRVCTMFGIDLKDTEKVLRRQADAKENVQPKVSKSARRLRIAEQEAE